MHALHTKILWSIRVLIIPNDRNNDIHATSNAPKFIPAKDHRKMVEQTFPEFILHEPGFCLKPFSEILILKHTKLHYYANFGFKTRLNSFMKLVIGKI